MYIDRDVHSSVFQKCIAFKNVWEWLMEVGHEVWYGSESNLLLGFM